MTRNLFALVTARNPDRSRVCIERPGLPDLTIGQVFDTAGQVANALAALGVKAGDRVAVQVDKSAEALCLFLGCLRLGAIYLPLNTGYTASEIGYFLGDAEPALFVCAPERLAELEPVATTAKASVRTLGRKAEGSLWPLVAAATAAWTDHVADANTLAAILYTSGTTGRSKGAMLSHDNLSSNALTLVDYWRFTDEDVLIHALPIFHTHGLFVATNVCLLSGAKMILLTGFDADAIAALLPKATALMGVPTFYTRLVEHAGVTRETTRNMRLFVSGSAPLLAETHVSWRERTGHAILERYGMTETNMNTSNPYDGDRVAGTVGFPLPGVSLRVTDPATGAELPQGEIGMIEVKGPNVFKGYWRMPEKTASEFRADGFFITGDLGKVDERGYTHIVGRGKDLIISGGFNVYPKEVEAELDELPGVLESAVIGVAHPDFGEGVTAVVVPHKGAVLDEAALAAAIAKKLAKFKLPKRIIVAAELPRNTMGKVQKNLLRDAYRDLYKKT